MNDSERMTYIARATGGDGDALQLLLIEHHDALRARISAQMPQTLNRHLDADDIVQETYVRAFASAPGGNFPTSAAFHAWLDEIAINTLRDQMRFWRRQKRDVQRDVHAPGRASESYEQLFDRLTAGDSTPSRKVAKAEAAAAVISSLARLTEEQREVVRLRFLQGWPVADVAQQLGKSEAAVHMLCHRGLKALREVMLSMSRFISGV